MARGRLLLVASIGLAVLGIASAASALTISPNPLHFDEFEGAFHGDLELLDVLTGLPAGADWVLGSVSPTSLTLVFQARIDPDSAPADFGLDVAVRDALDQGVPLAAVGVISGSDADWQILGSTPSGVASFVPAAIAPGTVFDRIFVSYDAPIASDGSLRLVAGFPDPYGTVGGSGSAAIVPEPASGALLGLGLGVLARRARRLRSGAAGRLR